MQDRAVVFNQIHRLIRCVIDCKLHLQDAVSVMNGLELARSLSARVWDGSPLQMKQVPNLGVVAVRKLVNANIKTLEELAATEPHRIELLLSRNAPFGNKILASMRPLPRLRVEIAVMGKTVRAGEPVQMKMRSTIGFLNESVPSRWNGKMVYVCFVAETSDGRLVEFRRMRSVHALMGLFH